MSRSPGGMAGGLQRFVIGVMSAAAGINGEQAAADEVVLMS